MVSSTKSLFGFGTILTYYVLLFSCNSVQGVTCLTCNDQIPGCKGGATCFLATTIAKNANTLATSTADAIVLKNLLPLKFLTRLTKGFLDAVKLMVAKTSPGVSVDWTSLSPTEVARAPHNGIGSKAVSAFCFLLDSFS